MKEIKFRVWDNENKSFVSNLMLGVNGCLFDKDSDTMPLQAVDCNRYTVEFYTGWTDGYCKEIYVGDIIETIEESGQKYIQSVVWCSLVSRFEIKQIFPKAICVDCALHRYTDGKIIGNIHENPELLKTE